MSAGARVKTVNEIAVLRGYQDLKVWQKAMELAEFAYRISRNFPKDEQYALTSQLRRAAASIPANIAEGSGRNSTRDFMRFIGIALGSLAETETHVLLAQRLRYLSQQQALEEFFVLADEVGRMCRGLQKSLEQKLALALNTST